MRKGVGPWSAVDREAYNRYMCEYQHIRYAKRRAAVDKLKLDSGCVDCGYRENAVALDFDHVRGEKIAGVAALLRKGASMRRILAEIEKCEVRCANCHRVATFERLHTGP